MNDLHFLYIYIYTFIYLKLYYIEIQSFNFNRLLVLHTSNVKDSLYFVLEKMGLSLGPSSGISSSKI